MLTRFAKAPGVAAILVVAAIFIIWDANLYGKDENRLIADKEKTTMAVSQTKPAIPPIDAAAPAKFQTATFALG
jgi:hypothetical protein